jgi:hypothetical protein
MNRHLSDVDVAALVHGTDKGAPSAEVTEHLVECTVCRQEFTFIVRVELVAPMSEDEATSSQAASFDDSAIIAHLANEYHRMQTPDDQANRPTKLLRLFQLPKSRLQDLGGRGEGTWDLSRMLPLAADSSAAELPVLYLDEPELMIRFRQGAEGEPIRAYVLAKEGQIRRRLFLHLPRRQMSIPIPVGGMVELVDVAAEDLVGANIGIELEELPEQSES